MSELMHRYLHGMCPQMAVVLALQLECGIEAVYPVHVKKDGSLIKTTDILHAYALPDTGLPLDAAGERSLESILAQFDPLLQSLLNNDDEQMGCHIEKYDSALDFLEAVDVDIADLEQALEDAAVLHPWIGDIELARREIARLVEEQSPAY